MKTFRQDLEEVINKHSMENGSNTPDFMLADYLMGCLRAFDKLMKRRDLWYGKKLVRKIVDEDKDDQQKIMEDIDYNNMCARATLYPGKSIAEVHDIQYMPRLEESYKFINSVLLGTTPMNDKQTHQWVTKTLEGRLRRYGVVAKCNEENNPPDVIDKCLLIAKVMRNHADGQSGYKYIDLVFGEEEQVKKYTAEWLLNKRLYNFIERGI